jgi:hypothetical protein
LVQTTLQSISDLMKTGETGITDAANAVITNLREKEQKALADIARIVGNVDSAGAVALEHLAKYDEENMRTNKDEVLAAVIHVEEVEARFKDQVSGWTAKDGGFNWVRLGADAAGGAILSTGAGLLTNTLIKNSQLSKGYESLRCESGGISAKYGETLFVR